MSPRDRPVVGILTANEDAAKMLDEWLRAAGFAPRRIDAANEPADIVLVRWPVTQDLSSARVPIVLLYEHDAEVPADCRQRVAEFVLLPDSSDLRSLLDWSSQLSVVLRHLTIAKQAPPPPPPDVCLVEYGSRRREAPVLVAIGVSTGGPEALKHLFAPLAGQVLPPIVIVQHIPTSFVPELAARLAQQTHCQFELAHDGVPLRPGIAYFAPGDHHLVVTGTRQALVAQSSDEPARRGHRPAAEVLFESCARLGVPGVGVIMTGMGQDGAQGLLALRQKGWATIGQDEASCAIYGMPRAAKSIGAVEREVPLAHLGNWLAMLCTPARTRVARHFAP